MLRTGKVGRLRNDANSDSVEKDAGASASTPCLLLPTSTSLGVDTHPAQVDEDTAMPAEQVEPGPANVTSRCGRQVTRPARYQTTVVVGLDL